MPKNTQIRRELIKQTALLFFVFAVLFTLLGIAVYHMVSENIYYSADEQLLSAAPQPSIAAEASTASEATAATAIQENALSTNDAGIVSPSIGITAQEVVVENPQLVMLMRNSQGSLSDTIGLYASYPEYLNTISFDPDNLDTIYQVSAGNHEYRAISYSLAAVDENAGYMQVLVNTDSELAILDQFSRALTMYLIAAVLISAAVSYLLSRRTLKPIIASWRAQTEFVQNASHELRTPLAVINTTGDLLLDSPSSRIVDKFEDINSIVSETKRLSRLIDDLMSLAMNDAQRTDLETESVAVDKLVTDVTSLYEEFALMQNKRVVLDLASECEVSVNADKIRQLLGIVLDNALKYTDEDDAITVTTAVRGSKCIISIADTGCGIDPKDRNLVFDRFYRADKARSRESGGYGLGLSLAAEIVKEHGGKIGIEANEPRGTIVVIMLPRL